MAYEGYTLAQLEAEQAKIEAKLQEVGAKYDAALPGEFHHWGEGPEDFQDSKSWYGDQIFDLYAELGYILEKIKAQKALIHVH